MVGMAINITFDNNKDAKAAQKVMNTMPYITTKLSGNRKTITFQTDNDQIITYLKTKKATTESQEDSFCMEVEVERFGKFLASQACYIAVAICEDYHQVKLPTPEKFELTRTELEGLTEINNDILKDNKADDILIQLEKERQQAEKRVSELPTTYLQEYPDNPDHEYKEEIKQENKGNSEHTRSELKTVERLLKSCYELKDQTKGEASRLEILWGFATKLFPTDEWNQKIQLMLDTALGTAKEIVEAYKQKPIAELELQIKFSVIDVGTKLLQEKITQGELDNKQIATASSQLERARNDHLSATRNLNRANRCNSPDKTSESDLLDKALETWRKYADAATTLQGLHTQYRIETEINRKIQHLESIKQLQTTEFQINIVNNRIRQTELKQEGIEESGEKLIEDILKHQSRWDQFKDAVNKSKERQQPSEITSTCLDAIASLSSNKVINDRQLKAGIMAAISTAPDEKTKALLASIDSVVSADQKYCATYGQAIEHTWDKIKEDQQRSKERMNTAKRSCADAIAKLEALQGSNNGSKESCVVSAMEMAGSYADMYTARMEEISFSTSETDKLSTLQDIKIICSSAYRNLVEYISAVEELQKVKDDLAKYEPHCQQTYEKLTQMIDDYLKDCKDSQEEIKKRGEGDHRLGKNPLIYNLLQLTNECKVVSENLTELMKDRLSPLNEDEDDVAAAGSKNELDHLNQYLFHILDFNAPPLSSTNPATSIAKLSNTPRTLLTRASITGDHFSEDRGPFLRKLNNELTLAQKSSGAEGAKTTSSEATGTTDTSPIQRLINLVFYLASTSTSVTAPRETKEVLIKVIRMITAVVNKPDKSLLARTDYANKLRDEFASALIIILESDFFKDRDKTKARMFDRTTISSAKKELEKALKKPSERSDPEGEPKGQVTFFSHTHNPLHPPAKNQPLPNHTIRERFREAVNTLFNTTHENTADALIHFNTTEENLPPQRGGEFGFC